MKLRSGNRTLSIMSYLSTTHRCPLGIWADQSVTPFSQQLLHLSAFKHLGTRPSRGHLCHPWWTITACSQQECNVSPMMRSNQMLMSEFGTTILRNPPGLPLLPQAPSDAISRSNTVTSLKRQKERMSKAIQKPAVEENPNCAYKCVPSCGAKVQGNGHLKSQPGCGLH